MVRPGSISASGVGDQVTADLRQRAFVSHENGQLKLAEVLYREVLGRYPDDVQVTRALGVLALQTQRYEWAFQLLTEVYRVDQSAAVNDYLGNALCGLNRLHEALQYHERAIALAPTYASARVNRERVLRSLAQFMEASPSDPRTSPPAEDSISPDVVAAKSPTVDGVAPVATGNSTPSAETAAEVSESTPAPAETALDVTENEPVAADTAEVVGESTAAPVEIAPDVGENEPATGETAAEVGESALVAAETALAATERALAATERVQFMERASVDSVGAGTASIAWGRIAWRVERGNLAPTVVSCVLSVLLVAEVVHAAKAALRHERPLSSEMPLLARGSSPPHGVDAAGIAARHLFGEVQGQGAETAPVSSADLKLTGILATEDPHRGLAIIGDQGKSHVYSIGDSLGDVSLQAIYRDRVVITRGGALESLFLPRSQSADQPGARLIASSAVALANPATAAAPEAEPMINKFAESNLETDGSGSLLGIRVVPGQDRTAFANSGLIGGDIVVALDGAKVDADRGQDLWKQAGSGSVVTVLRRGVMKEITLNLSP